MNPTSDVVARLEEEMAWFVENSLYGSDSREVAAMRDALALISSLVAENERLIRDNIVAPAECDEECDDPDCPYQHRPLTLRQAYDNAVSRLRDAEDISRRHHRAMAASDEARTEAERLLAEARAQMNTAHQLAASARDRRSTADVPVDDIQAIVEATAPLARASIGGGNG
jgi:hypothetical protein